MRLRQLVFSSLMLGALTPNAATAQQPPTGQDTAGVRRMLEQRAGRPVSQAEILQQLRESGMTRAQVRARLQVAGYDPSLADRYFDMMESGAAPPTGNAPESFLQALSRAGISAPGMSRGAAGRDTVVDPFLLLPDTIDADTVPSGRIEVFGLRVFRRAQSQFQPVLSGPVDSEYRIGPGDELIIVLTGDVELAYTLEVTREGHIFIPDVGQVTVNGLTLPQLDDRLYSRLGTVYSGVRRGAGATTRVQVSLGALRTNQVFVYGDVARPGAIQLSSLGTVFHALYMAGGPTAEGSFRRVEVHRGGRVVHVADLYDYLVRGSSRADIRLEQNDRVFVPPVGTQVRLEGSVRRPAIYEVLPGEGLAVALGFAGGLRSDALVQRVQIDRIVPVAQRQPGVYRSLVDVDLTALTGDAAGVPLVDGDMVTVFAVNDERRNRVWLDGEVRNPGIYEWRPGITLGELLQRADGATERAYLQRLHVYRSAEEEGRRVLVRASLDADGPAGLGLRLADNDSLVVLSRRDLGNDEFVAIAGYIKNPESYLLAEGMTLEDLILAAGGFVDGAYAGQAEVSRRPDPMVRSDTTAIIYRLPLGGGAANGANGANGGGGTSGLRAPDWRLDAGEFVLRHGDQVYVRRAPGFEAASAVRVTGEVLTPGIYTLATRGERVSDLLRRTGGLTTEAYPAGMHVIREGRVVAADFVRALENPRDRNNITLVAGDSLHVPKFDPTITIVGAVTFEARVLHQPGRSVNYYVDQAGGYAHDADRGRVTVIYPNGERTLANRGTFSRSPVIQPGAIVFVPERAARASVNWDQLVTRTAAFLSATATILIAVDRFR